MFLCKSFHSKHQGKTFQSEKTNQTFDEDILLLDDDDDFELDFLRGDAQKNSLAKAASVPVRNDPMIKTKVHRFNQEVFSLLVSIFPWVTLLYPVVNTGFPPTLPT